MLKQYRAIILEPLFSEKSMLAKEKNNVFAFKVAKNANKIQIKEAVEKLFDVTVEKVNSVVVKGKYRREGRFIGKRPDWKKAYVKLAENQTIEAFNISG